MFGAVLDIPLQKINCAADCVGRLVYSPLRSKTADYIFRVNSIAEECPDTLCHDYSYVVFDCAFTISNGAVRYHTQEQIYHLLPEDELFICPADKAAWVEDLLSKNHQVLAV
jgi:hypothetical protein